MREKEKREQELDTAREGGNIKRAKREETQQIMMEAEKMREEVIKWMIIPERKQLYLESESINGAAE